MSIWANKHKHKANTVIQVRINRHGDCSLQPKSLPDATDIQASVLSANQLQFPEN
jgi:hypothetical protein